MKTIVLLFFCTAVLGLAITNVAAQNKTIILVRHAEKDASDTADKNDPELTAEGKQRAERLMKMIKKYRPGAVFSTNYKRTRDTAAPMATRRKLPIQTYDARKPNDLIDSIMKSKIKRFLVVGHSNTIPPIVNLLGKKEVFKNLDDAEHGVIWLVRIKDGLLKKIEILPY